MKKTILFLLLVATSWSCDDLLEKTDLTGVDERVWDEESTATLYLNRLYDNVFPQFPNMRSVRTVPTALHVVSDESATGDNRVLFGNVATDNINDFYGDSKENAFSFIRRINILLTEIVKGGLGEAERNKIMGQAYFLRAWVYFNLVKLYGGVPLIEVPQNWITDDLFVPRSTTSQTFQFIIDDLDRAIQMLEPGIPATQAPADRGRITQDVVLAIKGRVLLFRASPQFNVTNEIGLWNDAYQANKAAFDSLTNHGCALYPNFNNILTEEGTGNKEVIMIRSHDGLLRPNSYENSVRPFSESEGGGGSFFPTWELVKAFPMADGKPAIENGTYANGFDSLYYWKNRDPRFYATIAYNGSVWELSSKSGRKQWTYIGITEDKTKQTSTGFYVRKGVNTRVLGIQAKQGGVDWIEMRFAEVILNLAEAANATGQISEAYDLIKSIRIRAGISANDDGLYGLKAGMTKDEMQSVIIEERRIELAFEGKRHDDLRRNRLFHLMNGKQRHSLLIKTKVNVGVLEAKDANGVMLRDKLDLNGTDYTDYFTPTYGTIDGANKINFKDEYYFYAIPTQNIERNPQIKQTINWPNGSFDPLAE